MSNTLSGLQPGRLWKHFDTIRSIPRASGDEQQAAAYVQSVAGEHGWSVARDAASNLRIRVPATAGHERAAGVVLQAHLDMVCEKNAGSSFDFSREPIEAQVNGDWVCAGQTTLGADNGIGVSAALAICEDAEAPHGPVEILLTVDEENTGAGAVGLDPSLVQGRMMINLDSEQDSMLVVGCAGGCSTEIEYPARRAAQPKGYVALRFAVHGLRGGHSGLTIQENRGNAIKLLARALQRILAKSDSYVWSFEGGNKHNSIPRHAEALVYLPRNVQQDAQHVIDAC